eukprot:1159126-Pelagomonas_calceolata.AAC.4
MLATSLCNQPSSSHASPSVKMPRSCSQCPDALKPLSLIMARSPTVTMPRCLHHHDAPLLQCLHTLSSHACSSVTIIAVRIRCHLFWLDLFFFTVLCCKVWASPIIRPLMNFTAI